MTEQQKEQHIFPRTQKGELLLAEMLNNLLPTTDEERWERSLVEPVET